MDQVQSLKMVHGAHQLKIYDLTAALVKKDIVQLEAKKAISTLTTEEIYHLAYYKESLAILIESTFLQIYAAFEACLYHECAQQGIKKNASIARFETALSNQGYNIDTDLWRTLLHISKIRNCLLHGNGRLDADQYGQDTKNTIDAINRDANTTLVEIIHPIDHREGMAKIKITEHFLSYCVMKIKKFI